MTDTIQKLPLRHISIRIPWHDSGWSGVVCERPYFNESCLRLKSISEHRGDPRNLSQCEKIASQSIKDLDEADWPCCVRERAMFMAPFEYERIASHPYVKNNNSSHGH